MDNSKPITIRQITKNKWQISKFSGHNKSTCLHVIDKIYPINSSGIFNTNDEDDIMGKPAYIMSKNKKILAVFDPCIRLSQAVNATELTPTISNKKSSVSKNIISKVPYNNYPKANKVSNFLDREDGYREDGGKPLFIKRQPQIVAPITIVNQSNPNLVIENEEVNAIKPFRSENFLISKPRIAEVPLPSSSSSNKSRIVEVPLSSNQNKSRIAEVPSPSNQNKSRIAEVPPSLSSSNKNKSRIKVPPSSSSSNHNKPRISSSLPLSIQTIKFTDPFGNNFIAKPNDNNVIDKFTFISNDTSTSFTSKTLPMKNVYFSRFPKKSLSFNSHAHKYTVNLDLFMAYTYPFGAVSSGYLSTGITLNKDIISFTDPYGNLFTSSNVNIDPVLFTQNPNTRVKDYRALLNSDTGYYSFKTGDFSYNVFSSAKSNGVEIRTIPYHNTEPVCSLTTATFSG